MRYFLIRRFLKANKIKFSPFSKRKIIWGLKEKQYNGDIVIEDGFIRSNGLGVLYSVPYSLIFDDIGIYFDATKPSKLEHMLNNLDISPELISRARCIINSLIENRLTKYNVGYKEKLAVPCNKLRILVIGQVDSDASIKYGSPEIRSSLELLRKVRRENSHAYIIFKPHPDVVHGFRDTLGENEDFHKYSDMVVTNISIVNLFDVVDEVHTITSLSGFEAILRNKKVITYGMPFYAGWGLTIDKLSCPRRTRNRTLEELVACALILYPTYIDPESGLEITVENTIERLSNQDLCNHKIRLSQKLLITLRSVFYFFKNFKA